MFQQQIAPPGQSLNDITQVRLQQQYAQQLQAQQMQAMPMMAQPTGAPMMPMATGLPPPGFGQPQFMQPMMTGMPPQQMMQAQPTGFTAGFGGPVPPGVPVNAFLPPALEPQRTGMPPMQPQPTGMGFTQGFGNAGMPPQQQPAPMQPLVPQQTGPPPPVRFGVNPEANKLAPQPTGRRANLAQASKPGFPRNLFPGHIANHALFS
jgi:hypothetical protein